MLRQTIVLSALVLVTHFAFQNTLKPARPVPPAPVADVPAKPAPPVDSMFVAERVTALAPIQIASLSLTPLVETSAAADALAIVVLDEAMAEKLASVTETGSVNELQLSNRSDRPLFVLAGEVIIGGKQDRVIAANTVIPPKTTQLVPVFCVEHGRWHGEDGEFRSGNALAHNRLRSSANYAGQTDVWAEVAQVNRLRRTTNATDTYREVAAQQRDGAFQIWEKQFDAAIAKLPPEDRDRMVGYAVAVNGRVAAIDLFRSRALFRKLERKLVRSYLTEAVDITPVASRPVTVAEIKAFMADADAARLARSYDTSVSSMKLRVGKHVGNSRVDYRSANGDRHLYSNYLGNNPGVDRSREGQHLYPNYLGIEPRRPADRHLYPSYLGNR